LTEWIGGQRRIGPHQKIVAIGRLMMDVERGQRAVGARPILDDDRLPERLAERIGDDAAERVAGAAGTERIDEGDRPRWKIFGVKS
jgi:hypothetical protein